jgi:hypothetical protein
MPFGHDAIDVFDDSLALVHDWEKPGIFTDKVGSNDADNYGTVDIAGKVGRARFFDLIDDRIDVPHNASIADMTSFSVYCLVKPNSIGTLQSLFAKYDAGVNKRSYLFYIRSNGSLRGIVTKDGTNAFKSDSTSSAADIVANKLSGCLMTFGVADKTVRIYVNGVNVGITGDTNADAIASFSDIDANIGAWLSSGTPISFFGGTQNVVYFWRNAILTQAAAVALWNGGSVRYWTPNRPPDAINMPSLGFSRMGRASRRRR